MKTAGLNQVINLIFCQLTALWLASQLSVLGLPLLWLQPPLAMLLALILRQPLWWLSIHCLFLPAVWLAWTWQVPPAVYLGLFILLSAVFWSTAFGEVPLFLSSDAVSAELMHLIRQQQATRLIELGAGVGSVVVPLAKLCPYLQITAVEHAPLPWLILRWRCRHLPHVQVLRQDLWQCDLSAYPLVFAFLAPHVMRRLAAKCAAELCADAILVSSCFPIPGKPAAFHTVLPDRLGTSLYGYRFPQQETVASKPF